MQQQLQIQKKWQYDATTIADSKNSGNMMQQQLQIQTSYKK